MTMGTLRTQSDKLSFSWRGVFRLLGCSSFILFFIFLIPKSFHNEYFPITDVKVFGIHHVNHEELQNLILPFISKGFFRLDLAEIKEQILQLAWVNEVTVQRVWPDKVMISLNEKNPVARWNDESLLSDSGEIFTPSHDTYPSDLPQFVGPSGEQLKLIRYYAKINNLFSPLHFKIARLELLPLQGWNITLTNGIKLNAGYKDILTRISHFVKVYPKIVGAREADVEYIDLRYPNGMAVRWKSVT